MTAEYAFAVNLRACLFTGVDALIIQVVARVILADIADIDRNLRAIPLHRGTETLVNMLAREHQVDHTELGILRADRADIVQKGVAAARAHNLHQRELCALAERNSGLYARKPLCVFFRAIVHDSREGAACLEIQLDLGKLTRLRRCVNGLCAL